jgi:hypothetical protein
LTSAKGIDNIIITLLLKKTLLLENFAKAIKTIIKSSYKKSSYKKSSYKKSSYKKSSDKKSSDKKQLKKQL